MNMRLTHNQMMSHFLSIKQVWVNHTNRVLLHVDCDSTQFTQNHVFVGPKGKQFELWLTVYWAERRLWQRLKRCAPPKCSLWTHNTSISIGIILIRDSLPSHCITSISLRVASQTPNTTLTHYVIESAIWDNLKSNPCILNMIWAML